MPYRPQPLYLFDSAWQAQEVQDLLDQSYDAWLLRSIPPKEQRLYHYTDLAGLRGILASRSFWLTHAYALNDPAELEYGVTLTARLIDEALDQQTDGSPEHRALSQLRTSTFTGYGPLFHAYVASFCEEGDLLSQWREYGARGGGYSLGIEVTERTRWSVPGGPFDDTRAPYFRKVLYDPGEQKSLVREFLAAFAETVSEATDGSARGLPADERSMAPAWMGAHAVNYLFDLVVSFKHPAFAEEREWRLIRAVRDNSAADELQFREARGELVPFRPVHLYDVEDGGRRTLPLREVWFGPTLNRRATSSAVALLAAHERTREHPVALSDHAAVRAAAAALR